MNAKTLDRLNYLRIRESAASHCISEKGKEHLKLVVKKYAEEKTVSYYATMITSAIGGCMAILPYYFIWRIVSILIKDGNNVDMEQITLYASYIFITQMVAIITNFSSGIISHYMAFRVEKNIRRDAIKHIMNLPMGFFENEDSGKPGQKPMLHSSIWPRA